MRAAVWVWWLLLIGVVAAQDENGGGLRVNGELVLRSTAQFVQHLREAEPGSISLLEFSGDGGRTYQSIDEFWDGHTENLLIFEDDQWRLLDKDRNQPEPDWMNLLKRALAEDAVVYFYGCQTGWYDSSGLVIKDLAEGIAIAFSREFGVATVGCPEFVYYPGRFPDFGGQFFSNPTEPLTPGQSTPGGIWNVFRKGRWIPPANPNWVTTLKGLPRPRPREK